VEPLPGSGCHADGQPIEVGLIGCVAAKLKRPRGLIASARGFSPSRRGLLAADPQAGVLNCTRRARTPTRVSANRRVIHITGNRPGTLWPEAAACALFWGLVDFLRARKVRNAPAGFLGISARPRDCRRMSANGAQRVARLSEFRKSLTEAEVDRLLHRSGPIGCWPRF
jgi:hypothetical protein